jgi:hypothetical protein
MFTLPDSFARIRRQFVFPMNGPDDFMEYTSGDIWTSLAADAGVTAPAEGDSEWGRVQMATGATDNNEVMVRSTNEVLLFQADGSFCFLSHIQYTEANTDDANVAVGLADAAGANLLSDDGGGDNINSSGVLIFKVDGETVWRCACEINGTVKETQSEQTAGGASYQELMILGKPVDGTNYEFTYFLDRLPLTDATHHKQIKHTLAYASATEMRVVAGYVKAGGANSETLNIDYCGLVKTRV